MEAVRRLRDVMILTVFVLSIFALVGLQLYQGTLRSKCVSDMSSADAEWGDHVRNQSNWLYNANHEPRLCGNGSESGKCPKNFTCLTIGPNPNYGYTNFDNYGFAMLCSFRLMTQDYWESLYQMVLTSNGTYHIVFFIIVIFLGSFYLVNLILAIVAMSYDDCQKMEKEEEETEAMLDEEMEKRKEFGNKLMSNKINISNLSSNNNISNKSINIHGNNINLNNVISNRKQSTLLLGDRAILTVKKLSKVNIEPSNQVSIPKTTIQPHFSLFNLDFPFADDSSANSSLEDLTLNDCLIYKNSKPKFVSSSNQITSASLISHLKVPSFHSLSPPNNFINSHTEMFHLIPRFSSNKEGNESAITTKNNICHKNFISANNINSNRENNTNDNKNKNLKMSEEPTHFRMLPASHNKKLQKQVMD